MICDAFKNMLQRLKLLTSCRRTSNHQAKKKKQQISLQTHTHLHPQVTIICKSTHKLGDVCADGYHPSYLVNANWLWYSASDRDRWGRIVGLRGCNISLLTCACAPTYTVSLTRGETDLKWMQVRMVIYLLNLSIKADLGFAPQMT